MATSYMKHVDVFVFFVQQLVSAKTQLKHKILIIICNIHVTISTAQKLLEYKTFKDRITNFTLLQLINHN